MSTLHYKRSPCWHQWLTPIILATQEAEIRRIALEASPGKSSQDPISKKPITKIAGGVGQGIGPEFKPQHHKKEKKAALILVKLFSTFQRFFTVICTLLKALHPFLFLKMRKPSNSSNASVH
jgi:hypothetical protein